MTDLMLEVLESRMRNAEAKGEREIAVTCAHMKQLLSALHEPPASVKELPAPAPAPQASVSKLKEFLRDALESAKREGRAESNDELATLRQRLAAAGECDIVLLRLGKILDDAGQPDDVGPTEEITEEYYAAMDNVKSVALARWQAAAKGVMVYIDDATKGTQ